MCTRFQVACEPTSLFFIASIRKTMLCYKVLWFWFTMVAASINMDYYIYFSVVLFQLPIFWSGILLFSFDFIIHFHTTAPPYVMTAVSYSFCLGRGEFPGHGAERDNATLLLMFLLQSSVLDVKVGCSVRPLPCTILLYRFLRLLSASSFVEWGSTPSSLIECGLGRFVWSNVSQILSSKLQHYFCIYTLGGQYWDYLMMSF